MRKSGRNMGQGRGEISLECGKVVDMKALFRPRPVDLHEGGQGWHDDRAGELCSTRLPVDYLVAWEHGKRNRWFQEELPAKYRKRILDIR